MRELLTIGYEATTPEAFDRTLLEHDVQILVDVRAVAASRRRGFAKTALSNRLRDIGIGYVHLRDLGDPKPGREAARNGRWEDFRSIFGAHLETAAAVSGLATLRELACGHRVALVCYEADPETCHRTIIACEVAKTAELVVAHLHPTRPTSTLGEPRRANHYPCESRAAS